tara:strand:+ start:86 stop:481 length:396 start_codon:yes stop_codon:yes gene_type:complete
MLPKDNKLTPLIFLSLLFIISSCSDSNSSDDKGYSGSPLCFDGEYDYDMPNHDRYMREYQIAYEDMIAEISATRNYQSTERVNIMKSYGARPAAAVRINSMMESIGTPDPNSGLMRATYTGWLCGRNPLPN